MEAIEDNEILKYVSRTGSTQNNNTTWPNVKMILIQKIKNIEKDFFDPIEDIPQYPNVDNFNFDRLKSSLLDRLELFVAPPFTIQRMCELLIDPKKQYSRIDKFMRALEKNILVVSTVTDSGRRHSESEFRESLNGADSVEISIDAKVLDDQSNNESSDEIENQSQESPKEIHFHRLDDDVDEAPSPKKMRLDNDVPEETEQVDVEKQIITEKAKNEDDKDFEEIAEKSEQTDKEANANDEITETEKIEEIEENINDQLNLETEKREKEEEQTIEEKEKEEIEDSSSNAHLAESSSESKESQSKEPESKECVLKTDEISVQTNIDSNTNFKEDQTDQTETIAESVSEKQSDQI